MAYEYENDILELLKDIERERSLDLSKEINEVQEAYQTAKLIDNIVITTKKRLTEQERKAKAFDEVKQYALIKNKDFEDRKDTAGSNKEFNYFNTLQIANKAIINKCKQLEDK